MTAIKVHRDTALDGTTIRTIRIGSRLLGYAEAEAVARKTTAAQAWQIRDALERIAIEEDR